MLGQLNGSRSQLYCTTWDCRRPFVPDKAGSWSQMMFFKLFHTCSAEMLASDDLGG